MNLFEVFSPLCGTPGRTPRDDRPDNSQVSDLAFLTDSFTGCDWSGNTDETTWECCSSSSPCWLFEGDCDGDGDCIGHLICGSNNCFDSFSSAADCCYDPLGGKII